MADASSTFLANGALASRTKLGASFVSMCIGRIAIFVQFDIPTELPKISLGRKSSINL